MMKRRDCLEALARHVTDADIVLPVYSTAFDWIDIRPHPLNYLSHGAMGLASSHALGLALGRPDRRVIVLDPDVPGEAERRQIDLGHLAKAPARSRTTVL